MRDIKFRAWDKSNNRIFYWNDKFFDTHYEYAAYALTMNGKLTEYMSDNDSYIGVSDLSDNYKLMQYTGLKDKNGVDIYEGDIIKYRHKLDDSERTFTVVWDSEMCGFAVNDKRGLFFITDDAVSCIEVIGNIYENPELLEVQ